MKRTIRIGERDVDMVATGMTAVLYRRVFRRDFISESQKKDVDANIFSELAFIMAMQAEKPAKELMNSLTEENYWDWVDGFGGMDFVSSVDKIFSVYANQSKPTSDPKKKQN